MKHSPREGNFESHAHCEQLFFVSVFDFLFTRGFESPVGLLSTNWMVLFRATREVVCSAPGHTAQEVECDKHTYQMSSIVGGGFLTGGQVGVLGGFVVGTDDMQEQGIRNQRVQIGAERHRIARSVNRSTQGLEWTSQEENAGSSWFG